MPTTNYFTYTVSGTEATVTDYTGTATNVVIPSILDIYTVVAIGDNAFSEKINIQYITIPSTVSSIGLFAFFDCTSIQAFYVDSANPYFTASNGSIYSKDETTLVRFVTGSETSISILEGTTSIADGAFAGTMVTSVTIPSTVTHIGYAVFYRTVYLTSISVNASNTSFTMRNQVLYDTAIVNIYGCATASTTAVVFPDTVTAIPDYSFAYSQATSFTFGSNLTTIGKYAFYTANNFTSLVLPNTVTSIGTYSFAQCYKLATVVLSTSMTEVPAYAFYWSNAMTSLTIPEGIQYIRQAAFFYIYGVTNLTLPDSLILIESDAFANLALLENLYIGPQTFITFGAFYGCSSIVAITVDENNPYYTSLDGSLYNKTITNLILYCSGSSKTIFVIPEGVTTITAYAFYYPQHLTTVTFPTTLTTIGYYCFYWGSSISALNFLSTKIPTIGSNWIYGVPSSARGHALQKSNFPPPGSSLAGLTMGAYLDAITSEIGYDAKLIKYQEPGTGSDGAWRYMKVYVYSSPRLSPSYLYASTSDSIYGPWSTPVLLHTVTFTGTVGYDRFSIGTTHDSSGSLIPYVVSWTMYYPSDYSSIIIRAYVGSESWGPNYTLANSVYSMDGFNTTLNFRTNEYVVTTSGVNEGMSIYHGYINADGTMYNQTIWTRTGDYPSNNPGPVRGIAVNDKLILLSEQSGGGDFPEVNNYVICNPTATDLNIIAESRIPDLIFGTFGWDDWSAGRCYDENGNYYHCHQMHNGGQEDTFGLFKINAEDLGITIMTVPTLVTDMFCVNGKIRGYMFDSTDYSTYAKLKRVSIDVDNTMITDEKYLTISYSGDVSLYFLFDAVTNEHTKEVLFLVTKVTNNNTYNILSVFDSYGGTPRAFGMLLYGC